MKASIGRLKRFASHKVDAKEKGELVATAEIDELARAGKVNSAASLISQFMGFRGIVEILVGFMLCAWVVNLEILRCREMLTGKPVSGTWETIFLGFVHRN